MNLSTRPPVLPPRADRSLVILAWVVLIGAVGFVVWWVADVLLMAFAGILVAVFLHGLRDAVARLTGLSEGWSLAVVLALLGILFILVGWFLGAEIISQLDQLVPRLQKAWGEIRGQVSNYEWGRILLANTSFKSLAKDHAWLTRVTGGLFSSTLGAVASLLVVIFIGLYAAAAPRTYLNGLLRLVPSAGRQRATEVIEAVGATLHWWLIGTFVKMTVVGLATTIGLILLGMPLAMALGIIAFLLEFVPYAGPIMAAVPALLVALAVSPTQMAYVGFLYLGIQTLEGYIVSPLVDQRSVRLPPALAISAQLLLGFSSLGLLGVFIATPLAAVGVVLVKMLYIEDRLGECTDAFDGAGGPACAPADLPDLSTKPPRERQESG
ncbi:MAG TPA: AI-2E family transporter [Rhodocyclaceae bacterium]|nr:AI-2E family transporter [Rhodocyclaceae bacterium]